MFADPGVCLVLGEYAMGGSQDEPGAHPASPPSPVTDDGASTEVGLDPGVVGVHPHHGHHPGVLGALAAPGPAHLPYLHLLTIHYPGGDCRDPTLQVVSY